MKPKKPTLLIIKRYILGYLFIVGQYDWKGNMHSLKGFLMQLTTERKFAKPWLRDTSQSKPCCIQILAI